MRAGRFNYLCFHGRDFFRRHDEGQSAGMRRMAIFLLMSWDSPGIPSLLQLFQMYSIREEKQAGWRRRQKQNILSETTWLFLLTRTTLFSIGLLHSEFPQGLFIEDISKTSFVLSHLTSFSAAESTFPQRWDNSGASNAAISQLTAQHTR